MKKIISVFAVVLTCLYLPAVFAQVQERTIDEIKQESILRAEKGAYPLGGLNPQDVT